MSEKVKADATVRGENTGEKFEALLLKNQLCFPLYAVSKEVVRLYKPFLDRIGLTYTQYIAMLVLWEKRSATVKELGEALYLDSGTLTPLLKKMEAQGVVSRQRNAADERSVIVSLTQAGEALREQAAEIPAQIGKCLPVSSEESTALYNMLYRILYAMQ